MKKKLLLSVVVGLLVFIFLDANSQEQVGFVAGDVPARNDHTYLNDINSRAVINFRKMFTNIENEQWYKLKDGFTSKFTSNGVAYRVGFDSKGNWLNTVRVYDESKMSKDIRHTVKSNYYDYSITLVEEVLVKDQVAYVIHLNNINKIVKLRLVNGEVDVMEEISK